MVCVCAGVVVLLAGGRGGCAVQGVEGGVLRGGDVEAEDAGAAFFVESWVGWEVGGFLGWEVGGCWGLVAGVGACEAAVR